MYQLCTTTKSVSSAVQKLRDSKRLFLDCEGQNLGCADGALSLISIGSPHAAEVFLFDVLSLPRDALQLLLSSLLSLTPSARAKTKVVWDGRMDYAEFFFSYGCPIENVLDLQLIDILSRAKRGETEYKRLCRFARKTFPISEIRKLQLKDVHALNGMDSAIREHKVADVEMKNESIKKLHVDSLTETWMQRPLSKELLEYAATDIKRIAKLYDRFTQRGYLKPREQLCDLSSRYVRMHRETGKPETENIYLRGPYLPLSISLEIKSGKGKNFRETSKECLRCLRTIPERHFPLEAPAKKSRKKNSDEKKDATRTNKCKICTLIDAKTIVAERLKAENAKKAKQAEVQARVAFRSPDKKETTARKRKRRC